MHTLENCFIPFKQSITDYHLPKRFTFPFCYEPHPLCLLAAEELQNQLKNHRELQREFEQSGKMFGVLLVKNAEGSIGYLKAFSGKFLTDENNLSFVPPIVDIDNQADYFLNENLIINQLNSKVEKLLANPQLDEYQQTLKLLFDQQNVQLDKHRNLMTFNRSTRKAKRNRARESLTDRDLAECFKLLAKESVHDKNELRDVKR